MFGSPPPPSPFDHSALRLPSTLGRLPPLSFLPSSLSEKGLLLLPPPFDSSAPRAPLHRWGSESGTSSSPSGGGSEERRRGGGGEAEAIPPSPSLANDSATGTASDSPAKPGPRGNVNVGWRLLPHGWGLLACSLVLSSFYRLFAAAALVWPVEQGGVLLLDLLR